MECDPEEHRPAFDLLVEEEYIDMDVSSTAYLCYTTSSPPHSIEFEFHMSSNPLEREPITSPADELFYKGKLLPLHLPPRLQMVERLLENPGTVSHRNEGGVSPAAGSTVASTPFQSCNISPVSSCYVSGELTPEEYYECEPGVEQPLPKKSWTKKLKQIRQTSLGLKLKASREYLKSLFTRSAAADEPHAVRRARELTGSNAKAGKKNPFGLIRCEKHQVAGTPMKSMDKEKKVDEECAQRRSFSGLIKHHLVNNSSSTSSSSSCSSSSSSSSSSTSSCSSSSSSSFCNASSNGHHGPAMLKRSSSANSEKECSIQGAIAYCKKSQQSACGRKSFSDVGCCTLSPSKVAAACET